MHKKTKSLSTPVFIIIIIISSITFCYLIAKRSLQYLLVLTSIILNIYLISLKYLLYNNNNLYNNTGIYFIYLNEKLSNFVNILKHSCLNYVCYIYAMNISFWTELQLSWKLQDLGDRNDKDHISCLKLL